tara:strand:- start:968 stop:1105 length:138 start_codon:yes stop_codon:yes gene_type:complete
MNNRQNYGSVFLQNLADKRRGVKEEPKAKPTAKKTYTKKKKKDKK